MMKDFHLRVSLVDAQSSLPHSLQYLPHTPNLLRPINTHFSHFPFQYKTYMDTTGKVLRVHGV
ncbi:hypothetical protein K445DRAFT_315498, partial [Daldinia sp. EC12]